MTSIIELTSKNLRCDIAPDLGGAISGLWLGEIPVLRSTKGSLLRSVRDAGCYPLVPFSNRISNATLKWNGTQHPLIKNNGSEPHAIHGVGWQRPWTVLEQDPQFALLSYEHKADRHWPFAFDTSQAFKLSEDGLEISLSLTNQSKQLQPAGLGWHPYFVKRDSSHIAFKAGGLWDMNEDKLPTCRKFTKGLNVKCVALDIDNCFDGWFDDVHLFDGTLDIRLSSNLSRLVVFTNSQKDFIAIEPVSHVNNATNLKNTHDVDLGLVALQPGETLSAHIYIKVQRA